MIERESFQLRRLSVICYRLQRSFHFSHYDYLFSFVCLFACFHIRILAGLYANDVQWNSIYLICWKMNSLYNKILLILIIHDFSSVTYCRLLIDEWDQTINFLESSTAELKIGNFLATGHSTFSYVSFERIRSKSRDFADPLVARATHIDYRGNSINNIATGVNTPCYARTLSAIVSGFAFPIV